jgi:hypothetical protein
VKHLPLGTLDVALLEKTLREIKVGRVLKDEADGVTENILKSNREL